MEGNVFRLYGVAEDNLMIVSRDGPELNSLVVYGPGELLDLRVRINEYLQDLQVDDVLTKEDERVAGELISTVEACSIALQKGVRVPTTTIRTAVVSGRIKGAVKPKGRYKFPRREFDQWLVRYLNGNRRRVAEEV